MSDTDEAVPPPPPPEEEEGDSGDNVALQSVSLRVDDDDDDNDDSSREGNDEEDENGDDDTESSDTLGELPQLSVGTTRTGRLPSTDSQPELIQETDELDTLDNGYGTLRRGSDASNASADSNSARKAKNNAATSGTLKYRYGRGSTRRAPTDYAEMAAAEEERTKVAISFLINRISDVNVATQTFNCDFFISATWRDDTLEGKSTEEVDWDQVWTPQLKIDNAIDLKMLDFVHQPLRVHGMTKQGNVTYNMRFRGLLYLHFDLKQFPFDAHDLPIVIASRWPYTAGKNSGASTTLWQGKTTTVNLVDSKIRVSAMRKDFFIPDWILEKPRRTIHTSDPKTSGSGNVYIKYRILVPATRKPQYYLWNVGGINAMITVLSATTYFVDANLLADRMVIILTLFLASIAFKFVIADHLPKISYTTIVDHYLYLTMLLLFIGGIENVLSNWITRVWNNPELSFYMDMAMSALVILSFIIYILQLWYGVARSRRERAKQLNSKGKKLPNLRDIEERKLKSQRTSTNLLKRE